MAKISASTASALRCHEATAPYHNTIILTPKMKVLMHGALASWDLNALTVLALIIANASAYLPLLDKQRQNLASVALRADNFSPARVLSACFAHANEEHLFNNVRKAVSTTPSHVPCLRP